MQRRAPGVAPPGQAARGVVPSWPRQEVAWPGGGPPPAVLRASGVFREIGISGIFLEFSGNIDFSPFSAMHIQ